MGPPRGGVAGQRHTGVPSLAAGSAQVPVKERKKRRLGKSEDGSIRCRAEHKDHVWCWDFVFDHTVSGSQLKWLPIVDEHTRQCLALNVDRSITSEIDTLADLFAMRGVPKCIRSDNGPEFVAKAIRGGSAMSSGVRCVRESVGHEEADQAVARELQPSAAAQLVGLRDPYRVRGPLYSFSSGFDYASAPSTAKIT